MIELYYSIKNIYIYIYIYQHTVINIFTLKILKAKKIKNIKLIEFYYSIKYIYIFLYSN